MLRVTTLRVGSCRVPAHSAGLPDRGKVMLPALAHFIETDTTSLLVDCGYGDAFFTATEKFPGKAYRLVTPVVLPPEERLVKQLPRLPDQVVLTHMHGDHVAGLLDLPAHIPVSASRQAIAHLRGLSSSWRATLAACPPHLRDGILSRNPQPVENKPAIATGLAPFPHGHDLTGTGEVIAIPLPGHGVGQIGIWLPNAATFLIADAAYARDALRTGRLPPAFVLATLGNAKTYRDTFDRLRSLMQERPDISVIPSHCRECAP
ncbi:MBL fold metallo-hydrolase [Thalassospira sp. TSL5-1]|uniref:MBL fold metallo-hydrolase n=1 Tax=Thalassospira sp. TSL5-1 TaxID=1544451 RepID=UPI00093E16D3|nr:MBL fold metallo-hydrolase [Thalassospira sp. TSL5-1]OKH90211.1 beta-lactamase [Thalassospira sp. TSL5-1]